LSGRCCSIKREVHTMSDVERRLKDLETRVRALEDALRPPTPRPAAIAPSGSHVGKPIQPHRPDPKDDDK
jgi:hypothetical protein